MFERFTDRARRVLVLAQEEARLLNHNFIGTEHILLGLVYEGEGIAYKAITSLGVSLDELRTAIEKEVGPVGDPATGSPPFTPRAKSALEMALREALQLGHHYIGTEHLLLGLIREGKGVAAQVLAPRIDLSSLRHRVIMLLGGPVAGPARPESTGPAAPRAGDLSLVGKEEGVVPADFVFDPHEIVTREDVEELLRDSTRVHTVAMVSFDEGPVEHRRCDYEPKPLPVVNVTVAGADVTPEAFARSAVPERFRPIDDLGDAAAFDASTSAVRVLCGSVMFSVAVERHRDPYGSAVALARKAVERLQGRLPD